MTATEVLIFVPYWPTSDAMICVFVWEHGKRIPWRSYGRKMHRGRWKWVALDSPALF